MRRYADQQPPQGRAPLVAFNTEYYSQGTPGSGGYWFRCLVDAGLDRIRRDRRRDWLEHAKKLRQTRLHWHIQKHYSHPSDKATFAKLLAEHGDYSDRFFRQALRPRLADSISGRPNGAQRIRVLLEDAWGYTVSLGDSISHAAYFVADLNNLDRALGALHSKTRRKTAQEVS